MRETPSFVRVGEPEQVVRDGLNLLMKTIEGAQRENVTWIERRFQELRRELPLVDGILVDSQGRVLKTWSTLQQDFPPSLEEIMAMISKRDDLVYPLVPKTETKIFFPYSLLDFLVERLGELKPKHHGLIARLDIEIAFIQAGLLAKLRKDISDNKIVLGRLGVWKLSEEVKDEKGKVVAGYLPHARIKYHPAVGKGVVFTPIPMITVLLKGKIPIDEREDVYRLEVRHDIDFVLASFLAYEADETLSTAPLLLHHTSQRPSLRRSLD